MRIIENKLYAIVTGDVVASTRLSAVERRKLHQSMSAASRAARRAFKRAVPFEVNIFRGDGWQMLLTDPIVTLRVALFYRAFLRSSMNLPMLDTRMAMAIGTIDFIPDARLSEGDGQAYRASGQGLETMSKMENMRFFFPGLPEEAALNVVFRLTDRIAARWSDKQALAVTGALQGWKQGKIAKTCWPKAISQQAVAQHLERAGWHAVESAIDFFEESVRQRIKTSK